jgi:hypothetical protein
MQFVDLIHSGSVPFLYLSLLSPSSRSDEVPCFIFVLPADPLIVSSFFLRLCIFFTYNRPFCLWSTFLTLTKMKRICILGALFTLFSATIAQDPFPWYAPHFTQETLAVLLSSLFYHIEAEWFCLLAHLPRSIPLTYRVPSSPTRPCKLGCCSKTGVCGLGPKFCAADVCESSCDAKSECDPGWGAQ